MSDDDDDILFGGAFENGHWIWDEGNETLAYVSDIPPEVAEAVTIQNVVPTGTIEFSDDVDVLDQIRYRRRYQRKLLPGQADVITLQDVKDIALFTAPFNILSPMLIDMLHLPSTERFLRALILYCQYYIQVADTMQSRTISMETKLRTPMCDVIENEFINNISDLRVVLAKEYCVMLIGGGDTKKFHHKGPHKKRRSLTFRDARLFQTWLRMCVQIVWLALGRKSFAQIEVEVNRLMKSDTFNDVEHNLKTGMFEKMSKDESHVLLGDCNRREMKLLTHSPLIHEVFCLRKIDFRMFSFGVIKAPELTARIRYMMLAVSGPEEELVNLGVTVGIIGLPRSGFDTMLHPIAPPIDATKSRGSIQSATNKPEGSSSSQKKERLYPEIALPPKDSTEKEYFPDRFPCEPEVVRHCSDIQRRRWQHRLHRLLHPRGIIMPPRSRDRITYREVSSQRQRTAR